jgi:hypothetical protein
MNQTLGAEARNIQNIALGGLLLWRFCVAYEKAHKDRRSPPILLLSLILPIVFTEELVEQVSSTQEASGLRLFVSKLASSAVSKNDLLFSLRDKVEAFRELTLASLAIAVSSKLLSIQTTSAVVMSLSETQPSVGITASVKHIQKQSEKIGVWFSQLSLHEISSSLKVGL